MVTLTPDLVGNTFVVMVVLYVAVFIYNIYLLVLNRNQAKVMKLVQETNDLLRVMIEKFNELIELVKR